MLLVELNKNRGYGNASLLHAVSMLERFLQVSEPFLDEEEFEIPARELWFSDRVVKEGAIAMLEAMNILRRKEYGCTGGMKDATFCVYSEDVRYIRELLTR